MPEKKSPTNLFPGHAAWIDGEWKLHRMEKDGQVRFELYDLARDPNEKRNLVKDRNDRKEELQPDLMDWLRSVVKNCNGEDY